MDEKLPPPKPEGLPVLDGIAVPPSLSEALNVEGVRLSAQDVERLHKLETHGSRLGRFCGTVLVLVGLGLMIAGLSGSITWIISFWGISSRVTNATPGVFAVIAGVVLLVASKPVVNIRNINGRGN